MIQTISMGAWCTSKFALNFDLANYLDMWLRIRGYFEYQHRSMCNDIIRHVLVLPHAKYVV